MDIYVGNNVDGGVYEDLDNLQDIALIGTAGVGKTVYLCRVLKETMEHYSPDEVRFLVYDDKGIEYDALDDSPYLLHPRFTHRDSSSVEEGLSTLEEQGSKHPEIIVVIDDVLSLLDREKSSRERLVSFLENKPKNIHFFMGFQNIRPWCKNLVFLCKTRLFYKMLGEHNHPEGYQGDMEWKEAGDVLLQQGRDWKELRQTVQGSHYLSKY